LLAQRFYSGPRDLTKVAQFKRALQAKLAESGIDRAPIERRAAAFEPKPEPALEWPAAPPYSPPLRP